LMRWRADGFDYFDASLDGFWKSFWAVPLCFPIFVLALLQDATAEPPASPGHFGAIQVIAYAIGWLAFPLLMVRISRILGCWPRYFTYMVAYNWFQLVQSFAWLPVLVLSQFAVVPNEALALLWLSTQIALCAYDWFIARHGLKVEAGTAAALVLIDFLLGHLIDGIASRLV